MRPAQVPRPGRGRAETRSQAHPRPRTQPPSRGAHLRPVHAVCHAAPTCVLSTPSPSGCGQSSLSCRGEGLGRGWEGLPG